MRLRLDLHTHSAASPDGRMSIDELVRAAKAAGLDGVAVTDHDAVLTDPPTYDDFLVIPGCEFSTEYGHLLGLFLREPIGSLSRKCATITSTRPSLPVAHRNSSKSSGYILMWSSSEGITICETFSCIDTRLPVSR